VLVVPPDHSRVHSRSGDLTRYAWQYYGDRLRAVLPALGTHAAMQPERITRMLAKPHKIFFACIIGELMSKLSAKFPLNSSTSNRRAS
jgi:hypothetical protein